MIPAVTPLLPQPEKLKAYCHQLVAGVVPQSAEQIDTFIKEQGAPALVEKIVVLSLAHNPGLPYSAANLLCMPHDEFKRVINGIGEKAGFADYKKTLGALTDVINEPNFLRKVTATLPPDFKLASLHKILRHCIKKDGVVSANQAASANPPLALLAKPTVDLVSLPTQPAPATPAPSQELSKEAQALLQEIKRGVAIVQQLSVSSRERIDTQGLDWAKFTQRVTAALVIKHNNDIPFAARVFALDSASFYSHSNDLAAQVGISSNSFRTVAPILAEIRASFGIAGIPEDLQLPEPIMSYTLLRESYRDRCGTLYGSLERVSSPSANPATSVPEVEAAATPAQNTNLSKEALNVIDEIKRGVKVYQGLSLEDGKRVTAGGLTEYGVISRVSVALLLANPDCPIGDLARKCGTTYENFYGSIVSIAKKVGLASGHIPTFTTLLKEVRANFGAAGFPAELSIPLPVMNFMKLRNVFQLRCNGETRNGSHVPLQAPPNGDLAPAKPYVPSLLTSPATQTITSKRNLTIVTASPAVQACLKVAELIAKHPTAGALILGETGTGKELVARYIHLESQRAKNEFVAVNCAAIPENLLESELFGHEIGSFTGAIRQKVGKFELANGGTILLDEISEMPPALQAKLLRVLQEKNIDRVGGTKSIPIDVRVIASTHRNMPAMIKAGTFREDLYYRLNIVPIALPALRERVSDIAPLLEHFISKFDARHQNKIPVEVLAKLYAHSWPGNVRELENVVLRAVVLSQGRDLRSEDFVIELDSLAPQTAVTTISALSAKVLANGGSNNLAHHEKTKIIAVLEEHNGNRTLAAKALGIDSRTLRNKLTAYQREDGVVKLIDLERAQIETVLNQNRWNKSAAAKQLGIARQTLDNKIKAFQIAEPNHLVTKPALEQ